MFIINTIIILLGLLIGTITDLKTREVPDFLNFSLIASGIFLAIIASLLDASFTPLLHALLGLAIGTIIGYIMFYTGQWGGGDSKMIMGLGALIGMPLFSSISTIPTLPIFVLNIILVGAVYGLAWVLYNAIRHYKKLLKEIKNQLPKKRTIYIIIATILFILLISYFTFHTYIFILILSSLFILIIFLCIWTLTKFVEKYCMLKQLPITKITPGDWVMEKITHKGKTIIDKDNLGITPEQIAALKQTKLTHVLVKEGIPFVPSFLIAYLITMYVGNWILLIL